MLDCCSLLFHCFFCLVWGMGCPRLLNYHPPSHSASTVAQHLVSLFSAWADHSDHFDFRGRLRKNQESGWLSAGRAYFDWKIADSNPDSWTLHPDTLDSLAPKLSLRGPIARCWVGHSSTALSQHSSYFPYSFNLHYPAFSLSLSATVPTWVRLAIVRIRGAFSWVSSRWSLSTWLQSFSHRHSNDPLLPAPWFIQGSFSYLSCALAFPPLYYLRRPRQVSPRCLTECVVCHSPKRWYS